MCIRDRVGGQGGVPSAGVYAAVLNVTVTNPTTSGYIIAYPAGQGVPSTSNLNYVAGQTVANLVEVPVGSNGQVSFYAGGSATDLILDVQGYVPQMWSGTQTVPLATSGRICDTRSGNSTLCTGKTLAAGASMNVQVTGQGGVPGSGVAAVVMNLTVVTPASPGDFIVFPTGQAQPATSNLNWTTNQTVANRVVVPVGSGGQVTVFNQSGSSVNFIIDANAWITDGSNASSTGSLYNGLTATRICDTRSGNSTGCSGKTIATGGTLAVQAVSYKHLTLPTICSV